MSLVFSHLQLHTHYSVSEGLCRVDDIAEMAKSSGIMAVALTDLDNLFAWVKFYRQFRSKGVKPIPGADILVDVDGEVISVTALCLNDAGYKELISALSRAYQNNERVDGRPVIPVSTLKNSTGIVAVVHAKRAVYDIIQSNKLERLEPIFDAISELKSGIRLYGGLTRLCDDDDVVNVPWSEYLYQQNIPMVALNSVCFKSKQDYHAHDIRVCIDQGRVIQDKSRPKIHSQEQYFKTATEMHQLFSDVKQVIENTNHLAMRCNVKLEIGNVYLPEVGTGDINEYFTEQVMKGLDVKLSGTQARAKSDQVYHQRVEREIKTIVDMGFASYFMIVADFIQWAKDNSVPVGPGRGSGAGSLAAYALKITDIDPLEYDLLFERFLNPERVSMPDFDIDFCMIGRDRVIDYVSQKYGRLNVSQIITFGSMAAKAVIRDVGRVLGHPYGFVDRLAKLIPFDLGITLDKALAQEPMLAQRYESETEVRELFDLSRVLEGLVRNVGTHAGGVVIAPSAISDFSPTYQDGADGGIVTQYDKDDIEKIGLVKFDFLGLRTLTIIDWAIDNIKKSTGASINLDEVSLHDKKAFDLLQACSTTGVFQLESQGMKDLIDRLVPDCFEDIVALVALYRPGPLQSGMVDDFVRRKHGIDEVVYQHPKLEPILNNTYGVILYQEQVMQIAQDLANYSLGGADLLRRAMGKKKPEEMAKQRVIFMEGAEKQAVDLKIASDVFELMEKFAGYGFNKSHSAAYALISYQTAWLKANYPTEFMAAVLSSDMDNTDKMLVFLDDVKCMGLKVLPPCVNYSQAMFSVVEEGVIRYGLAAIKGVGHQAADSLVQSRDGVFKSLLDVCTASEKMNRKLLESLIKSGACDVFKQDRGILLASVDSAISTSSQQTSNQLLGQQDLLGDDECEFSYVSAQNISNNMKLQFEKETLGYYLSGHPVSECREELNDIGVKKITQVTTTNGKVRIAGVVNKMKVVKTKKGSRIAFVEISDDTGKIDVALFDEIYTDAYETLNQGGVILIEGTPGLDQFTQKVRLQGLKAVSLDSYRVKAAPVLWVQITQASQDTVSRLVELLKGAPGKSPVVIKYVGEKGAATFPCPHKVSLTEDLLERINVTSSVQFCKLHYQVGSAQLIAES